MVEKAKAKLDLNIFTPRGVKFERQADFLSMRAIDGDIGILPNRAPMASALGDGILKIVNDGEEDKFALFQGIVEVENNKVNIYTTIAQHPEEIDLERARREKEEAENALKEEVSEYEMRAHLLQIRRAFVRMEAGTHAGDLGYFDDPDDDKED